jgi:hypothetical protein
MRPQPSEILRNVPCLGAWPVTSVVSALWHGKLKASKAIVTTFIIIMRCPYFVVSEGDTLPYNARR